MSPLAQRPGLREGPSAVSRLRSYGSGRSLRAKHHAANRTHHKQ
jgi:hypothetical protein